MEIKKVFKDSLKYPINNPQHFVIIAILYVIASIPLFITSYKYGQDNAIVWAIFVIIELIIGFILGGYEISIISYSTTYYTNEAPKIECQHDFIMGIKSAIVSIVYFIIPLIIVLIVGVLTGFDFLSMIKLSASTATDAISSSIPATLLTGAMITGIVAVVLSVIFSFFALVAYGRLGKSNSLAEALNILEVIKDIGKVGWLKFIEWFIIFVIINIILGLISSAISFIPYIGIILSVFFIGTYILFFTGRAIGLMYSDV